MIEKIILKYILKKSGSDEESGGKPIEGTPDGTETITVKELLGKGYYVAYLKDTEAIHNGTDKDPEGKSWPVYKNVLKIKDSLNRGSKLPPIQVLESEHKVVDGAHRLNALNLLMVEDPSWGSFKVQVDYFSPESWREWKKKTGQPEDA